MYAVRCLTWTGTSEIWNSHSLIYRRLLLEREHGDTYFKVILITSHVHPAKEALAFDVQNIPRVWILGFRVYPMNSRFSPQAQPWFGSRPRLAADSHRKQRIMIVISEFLTRRFSPPYAGASAQLQAIWSFMFLMCTPVAHVISCIKVASTSRVSC